MSPQKEVGAQVERLKTQAQTKIQCSLQGLETQRKPSNIKTSSVPPELYQTRSQ
jgi:hypothetical protein